MLADQKFYSKKKKYLTLKEIAELTGSELTNGQAAKTKIYNVASLIDAKEGDIAFLDTRDFAKKDSSGDFANTQASACIVKENADTNVTLLINKEPLKAFIKVINTLYEIEEFKPQIAKTAVIKNVKFKNKKKVYIGNYAVIEPDAEIGENVIIKSGAVIKKGCQIGDNTIVGENAVIQFAEIGNNVIIHPGVKIGNDGFGYVLGEEHTKLPHIGRVIIEDKVEIGANTTVDRGFLDDTVIKRGTKIDNLNQISHNVRMGANCVMAGQSGIAGSSELGNYVFMGAQTGITDHVKIGDMSQLGARCAATKTFPENSKLMGYPAMNMKLFLKIQAVLRRLAKK
jgi:UDP-3-O-[3-hydroxymyristoyl] glucosamine N-acyltransferase